MGIRTAFAPFYPVMWNTVQQRPNVSGVGMAGLVSEDAHFVKCEYLARSE